MTEETATAEDEALGRAVDAVYAVEPARFVATRKEWVARLRAEGLREVARQVGALRKPSVSAAAVNALVRADDPVVARLVNVGARMRHAQSTLDAAALSALRDDRDEVLAAWVAAAREHAGGALTAAVEAEVRDTAVAALADPAATEVATSGSLTRALSYSGFGEVDLADAVVRTSTGVVLSRLEGGRADGEGDEPDVVDEAEVKVEDDEPDVVDEAEVKVEDDEPDVVDEPHAEDDEPDVVDEPHAEDDEQDVVDEPHAEDDASLEEAPSGDDEDEVADEVVDEQDADATDLASLEMELDEAEKVVAAARALRRTAAQEHASAEERAAEAAEQLAEAQRLLEEARTAFEQAEAEQERTAAMLEEAEEELRRSRRQRDDARAALEEAEDS